MGRISPDVSQRRKIRMLLESPVKTTLRTEATGVGDAGDRVIFQGLRLQNQFRFFYPEGIYGIVKVTIQGLVQKSGQLTLRGFHGRGE